MKEIGPSGDLEKIYCKKSSNLIPSFIPVSISHNYRPQTKFAKVMFLHVSVCPQGGGCGGVIPACLAGFQTHTQREAWGVWLGRGSPGPHPGGKLRGLAWGVSMPTPKGGLHTHTQGGLQAHSCGGVSQHALKHTPPLHSWWLLLQAVRILLECILVEYIRLTPSRVELKGCCPCGNILSCFINHSRALCPV